MAPEPTPARQSPNTYDSRAAEQNATPSHRTVGSRGSRRTRDATTSGHTNIYPAYEFLTGFTLGHELGRFSRHLKSPLGLQPSISRGRILKLPDTSCDRKIRGYLRRSNTTTLSITRAQPRSTLFPYTTLFQ